LLTADLVRARKKGDQLLLIPLDAKGRAVALELAAALIEQARAHVGKTRAELDEVIDAIVGGAKDRKLADGLAKLVWDRAEVAEDAAIDPEELRHQVFVTAQAVWQRTGEGDPFNRAAALAAVAEARGLTVDEIERALYADLRDAHVVTAFQPLTPPRLVAAYDLAQPQAVLLRATRVVVEVESAIPGAYRTLFRKLKFLRLLCAITPSGKGYRIEIDGPFALFESSTKYGLALALALPAIRELDRWSLVADLRWGTARTPLRCQLDGRGEPEADEPHVTDEVAALLAGFADLDTPWRGSPAQAILDLPGVGVCAPDLAFEHTKTGECIYLEVMGYWSRDAVWKRVELVRAGLDHRILFAVGQQLRVSEAVLDDDLPGALYVYKRTMSAKAIAERLDALAAVTVKPKGKAKPAPPPADAPPAKPSKAKKPKAP
jgi:predicted nuclease of restriction endonuclease-like RecB superfamily